MGNKFTVEKGKSYEAVVRLEGLEAMASNWDIGHKLNDIGFRNVEVDGEGDTRTASGTWRGTTQTVDLPEQVRHIEEVNLVWTEDGKPPKK